MNIFAIWLKTHPLDPLPCAQGRGSGAKNSLINFAIICKNIHQKLLLEQPRVNGNARGSVGSKRIAA
jgi:hypothetical protein